MKPRVCHGVVRVAIAAGVALACLVVASCHPGLHVDHAADYLLAVANRATDRVSVQVDMGGGSTFVDIGFSSGVFTLKSGENRAFRMHSGLGPVDSREDGGLVVWLRAIHFYEAGESVPYRSYEYRSNGCVGGGQDCWEYGDEALMEHERSDGTLEQLFVESPDRPFYLERDKDDLDLGRIVITFVPSVEEHPEKGVEQMAAPR